MGGLDWEAPWLYSEPDVDQVMLTRWRKMLDYQNAQPGGGYYRMASKEQERSVQSLFNEIPIWAQAFFNEPYIAKAGDKIYYKYHWLNHGALAWLGVFHNKEVINYTKNSDINLSQQNNKILKVAVTEGMGRWDYLNSLKGYVGDVVFTHSVGSVVFASFHYQKGYNWHEYTQLFSLGEEHIALKGLGLVPTFHDYVMSSSAKIAANQCSAKYAPGQITWSDRPHDAGMALMYDALRSGVGSIISRVRGSQVHILKKLISEKVSQKIGNPNYEARLSDYADAYRWFNQIVLFMLLNDGFEKPTEGVSKVLSKKLSYECDEKNIQFYPAGMTAVAHFLQMHLMTKGRRIAYTGQHYYEVIKAIKLLGKRYHHCLIQLEDYQDGIWGADIAMLELLPSNAGSKHQGVLNVENAIGLWLENKNRFSCMIDVTFGGYEHPRLLSVINRFSKEIKDGRLHLFLISSLAKSYPTLGSDIAAGGLCVYLGDRSLTKLKWMQSPAHRLLDRYFAYMMELNHDNIANRFFDLTVNRAIYLRRLLSKSSGLTVTAVSDPVPFCIASIMGFIGMHNRLVRRLGYSLPRAIEAVTGIPCRSSIGFPTTSVTDVVGANRQNIQHQPDVGFRFSVGLESSCELEEMANRFHYFAKLFSSLQLLLAVSPLNFQNLSAEALDNLVRIVMKGFSQSYWIDDIEIDYTVDFVENGGWLTLGEGPDICVDGHVIALEDYEFEALRVMIRAGLIDDVAFEFLSAGDDWTWPYSSKVSFDDEHFHIVQKSNNIAIHYTYGDAESLRINYLDVGYQHHQILVWCEDYLDWKILSSLHGARISEFLALFKRHEFEVEIVDNKIKIIVTHNMRISYYHLAQGYNDPNISIKTKLDYFEKHPVAYGGLEIVSDSGSWESMTQLFSQIFRSHVLKCLGVDTLVNYYERIKVMYESGLTKPHNIMGLFLWARCISANSPDLVAVKSWYNHEVSSSSIEKTLGYTKHAMSILGKEAVIEDLDRMAQCMNSWNNQS